MLTCCFDSEGRELMLASSCLLDDDDDKLIVWRLEVGRNNSNNNSSLPFLVDVAKCWSAKKVKSEALNKALITSKTKKRKQEDSNKAPFNSNKASFTSNVKKTKLEAPNYASLTSEAQKGETPLMCQEENNELTNWAPDLDLWGGERKTNPLHPTQTPYPPLLSIQEFYKENKPCYRTSASPNSYYSTSSCESMPDIHSSSNSNSSSNDGGGGGGGGESD
ncbi:hypothetical protein Pmani_013087 [Petrolisthes manimaculis]|uniref:Uncharacterized protein n=1 Tax=Petrolisthes manimaculis TaxID=1843537 RepID=A0AAE1PWH0_9EUCA|nr:hypothetical protein Pmani_013087 [Petrolisthes manimaculis]